MIKKGDLFFSKIDCKDVDRHLIVRELSKLGFLWHNEHKLLTQKEYRYLYLSDSGRIGCGFLEDTFKFKKAKEINIEELLAKLTGTADVSCDPEFKYPLYMKSKRTGTVVKFTGLTSGTIMVKGGDHDVGHTQNNLIKHTDDLWEDVTNMASMYEMGFSIKYTTVGMLEDGDYHINVSTMSKIDKSNLEDVLLANGYRWLHHSDKYPKVSILLYDETIRLCINQGRKLTFSRISTLETDEKHRQLLTLEDLNKYFGFNLVSSTSEDLNIAKTINTKEENMSMYKMRASKEALSALQLLGYSLSSSSQSPAKRFMVVVENAKQIIITDDQEEFNSFNAKEFTYEEFTRHIMSQAKSASAKSTNVISPKAAVVSGAVAKAAYARRDTSIGVPTVASTNQTNQTNKTQGKTMKTNMLDTLNQNKRTFTVAATVTAGRTANQTIMTQIENSGIVPFFAKGYLKHPLASVAMANMVSFAVKQYMPNNPKAEFIADAMMQASAIDTVDSFNIEAMVSDLINGIKLPAGISFDVEPEVEVDTKKFTPAQLKAMEKLQAAQDANA